MIRITTCKNSAAGISYFEKSLSKQDYYSLDVELPAIWRGAVATKLGIEGMEVGLADFSRLVENKHPITGAKLTPHTKGNRVAYWDMTFDVPKSLSLLYGLTQDEKIARAFSESVEETMQLMEKLTCTRIRKGGVNDDRLTSSLLYTGFMHTTARPVDGVPDPHLHQHSVVMQVTHDPVEGRFKAAKTYLIFKNMPYFLAYHQGLMAHKLEALGYPVEQVGKHWEVAGLNNKPTLDKFSRRTQQIEDFARENGIEDPAEKATLGVRTRARKSESTLTREELRKEWDSRLDTSEREMVRRTAAKEIRPGYRMTAQEAVTFAEEFLFEKQSVVEYSKFLAEAMNRGCTLHPLDIEAEVQKRGYIERETSAGVMITTKQVLLEEIDCVRRIREGRASQAPLLPGKINFIDQSLSPEQQDAVKMVLQGNDQFCSIRGLAGTGKSRALRELKSLVDRDLVGKQRVFAFALSATASRGELRAAGFHDADTIARLISDRDLQIRVKGKILLIDEAAMIDVRSMAKIMEIAGSSTKIVLCGDTGQHGPPGGRGEPMRLAQDYADISISTLKDIQRQKKNPDYKEAVEALSRGDMDTAFTVLNRMKAIREIADDKIRYKALASDYLDCLSDKRSSALCVSPRHSEAALVTAAIRHEMKARGKLGNDREVLHYQPLHLTAAEKKLAENYHAQGLVVQFNQNFPGIKRGSILNVVEVDQARNLWLGLSNGKRVALDMSRPDHFDVLKQGKVALAKGDLVKITRNGTDLGKKRLKNGDVFKLLGFTRKGELKLSRGRILPANFGYVQPGYVHTSVSSQGRTVDHVFIAQSSASGLAASKEQLYVSASRGRLSCKIFCDDRSALELSVRGSSHRTPALELTGVTKADFMTPCNGEELLKRFAIERAKRENQPGRTHVEKLLAARNMNPHKKPEGMSHEAYILMKRALSSADGRSRSRGQGRVKAKKQSKAPTLPKVAEMRNNAAEPERKKDTKPEKPQRKSRIAEKLETAQKRLKASLAKSLSGKSIKKDSNRSINIGGKAKVKLKDLNGEKGRKQQEEKHLKQQKQQRVKTPEKKAPVQAPPPPVIRRGK